MPAFRFEAMGSSGEFCGGQIEAENADEAMSMLRTRGLSVTALTEVVQRTNNSTSPESLVVQPKPIESAEDIAVSRQRPEGWRWGIIVTSVGLTLAACGLYGVIESAWLGMAAKRANARVVGQLSSENSGVGILEFTAAGRQVRVPARGAWGIYEEGSGAVGTRYSILYPPERPEDARLAAFDSRYGVPLIVLMLGLVFIPCGVLMLIHGFRFTGDESTPQDS